MADDADSLLICCTGGFEYVPFYTFTDDCLRERFRISSSLQNLVPEGQEIDSSVSAPGRYPVHSYSATGTIRVCRIPFPDPNRRVIALSSRERPFLISIYDVDRRAPITMISGHKRSVWAICSVSPNDVEIVTNPLLASVSDGFILLSDAVSGEDLTSLTNGPQNVYGVLHAPELSKNDLFVAGNQGALQYDLTTESLLHTYQHGRGVVASMNVDTSRNCLISASWDLHVYFWSRNDPRQHQHELQLSAYAINSFCSEEDDHLLIVGCHGGHVDIWDLRKLDQRLRSFCFSTSSVWDFGKVGQSQFVCVSADKSMRVFDSMGRETDSAAVVNTVEFSGACTGVEVLNPMDGREGYEWVLMEERIGFLVECVWSGCDVVVDATAAGNVRLRGYCFCHQ